MTRARRLWVVVFGVAVSGLIINSWSKGEPSPDNPPRPKQGAGLTAAPDAVADETSRFTNAPTVSYKTLTGERYFALQVKPELPAVPRRPRDYLIVVSAAASQAGPAWLASAQIAEGIIQGTAADDRVSLWTISAPDATRALTANFVNAKEDAKKIERALDVLKKKIYPAGATDLKKGLEAALASFDGQKSRQRLIVYLGDGQSTLNLLSAADRQKLGTLLADSRVLFFPVPLGDTLDPQNLHGLATTSGGAVLRTRIMEETLESVLGRFEQAFRVPVLYPSEFQLPEATEFYPSQLPPLRGDAPTLIVGKTKDATELSYTVKGEIAGGDKDFSRTIKQALAEPELDNFFLISMVQQWKKAAASPALIRGDRALAMAYTQTELQHHELLLNAELAVQKNELDAAGKWFKQVKELAPHDSEAEAGLKIVANLKSGKLTLDQLKKELAKDRPVDRLKKVNGRWTKDQLVHLAQEPVQAPGKVDGVLPPPVAEDLLQNRKDRILIEEQKMTETVEGALKQAARDLNTDPDAALDLLRSTLLQLRDHPDLGERVRDALMSRLQTSLRDVTSQGRAIKLRKEQELQVLTQVKRSRDEEQQRQDWEARAEAQFRIYRGLMNVGRVEQKAKEDIMAGVTDMQAQARLQGMPVPQATQAAYDMAHAAYHLTQNAELKRVRQKRFLEVMLEIEKSNVPYPDEPGIYFPPLSTWEAIRKIRKEKYEVTGLPDDYEGRKEAGAIKKLLDEEIETKDFLNDMTLREALQLLMEKFSARGKDLPILVDVSAFKEENPEAASPYDAQVKLQPFPRKMRLATMLRLLLSKLDPPNGTYMIRRNYIEITTIDRQTRERVLRVYPVGELVVPISQQLGMLGGVGMIGGGMMGMAGMGGMMGGGMMGGGMMGMGGMGMGGMGMMGMPGGMGMMGAMGMGGMMMGGPMMMGGMGMMGMPGGMGMMGAMGMGGMMMGGPMMMGGMGMGGMAGMMGGGMMGMGGGMMGMMGGGGMRGPGGGGNFQGGSFMGGFNGGLGQVGSINAPTLIATITQVVAPGEWFIVKQPEPFNQFLGGGMNFAGFGGAIGGQALGNLGNPPMPQTGPIDPTQANTISFFPSAQALIVRAPSRVHTDFTGGLIGAKQKRVEAAMGVRQRLEQMKPSSTGEGNKKGGAPTGDKVASADPTTIWQEALVKEVPEPGMVIAAADFLFEAGKYDHAAEFLKANLRQGILVRPWVYEALAVALEQSGGSPEEIRRARLSAVSLNPNDVQGFLEAARTMGQYKQWDRAIAFCRQAAALEPNLATPYAEAIGFAELAKDGQAMEWAAGKLLSQEWPVDSSGLHLRAQIKLQALARILHNQQRQTEAERLSQVLETHRRRDLIFRLTWEDGSDHADLDLQVKEPGGSVCSLEQRQTAGGGILIGNTLTEMNRASYVAAEAFAGDYEITVARNWGQPLANRARLEVIQHYGTDRETRQLVSLELDRKQIVAVKFDGGRRTALAAVPPAAAQRSELARGNPRTPSVYEKLRGMVDPDYSATQMVRAGAFTPGAHSPAVRERNVPARRQPEHRIFQGAISPQGQSGLNLAAEARLSADQQYLHFSLNPVFQTANQMAPAVNLPLIPGGGQ